MSLLDIQEVLSKFERDYVLDGKAQFQISVRARAGEKDFYQRLDRELRANSDIKIADYRLVKEGFAKVSRPSVLVLDAGYLLKVRPYVASMRNCVKELIARFQGLPVRDFIEKYYHDCSQDLDRCANAIEIFQYLLDHQREVVGLMPRQIPHGKSSKMIGSNQVLLKLFAFHIGESGLTWRDFLRYFRLLSRPAEFRFFAPNVLCQGHPLVNYNGVFASDWASFYSFKGLGGTLIVENIQTFFQMAAVSKKSLVVWGGGWRAAQLKGLFQFLPRPLYYWGDIDKEGYEIFGYLKTQCTELRPLLMSHDVVERYSKIQQRKEIYSGPFQNLFELQNEYEEVCLRGIQIEQEQLQESWPLGSELV